MVKYKPAAVDTSGIDLSKDLHELAELLARNSHRHWSERRLSEGWKFGPAPDYAKKEHPNGLRGFAELGKSLRP